MDWMFWWLADAMQQKETKGCFGEFMLILAVVALGFLVGTLIWGGK